MRLKDGVSIASLTDPMQTALALIEGCYAAIGMDCWVTSGDERTTVHHGQPVIGGAEDPHYEGKALDLRIWHVPASKREDLVEKIRATLGEGFVVLWENRGHANEHVHIQAGKIASA